jgi:hypothetical protein
MVKPYGEGTLDSIAKHCDRRGIPPEEIESVHAFIAEKFGKKIRAMDMPELRRVNRELPLIMVEYLGGHKRRGGGPPSAWGPADAAGGAVEIK